MNANDKMLSYAEIHERILTDIGDLASEEGRHRLVDLLSSMQFELNRLKTRHRALLTSLRFQAPEPNPQVASLVEKMPRRVVVDARDSLDTIDGFYDLEYAGTTAFRWTGPGPDVTFRAWIDRSVPVVMDLSFVSLGDSRNAGNIELWVDGARVPLSFGETSIRSAPLPRGRSDAATEAVLRIPYSFLPKYQGTEDERELGIAFVRVEFRCQE
jgi:hypothetical protein